MIYIIIFFTCSDWNVLKMNMFFDGFVIILVISAYCLKR